MTRLRLTDFQLIIEYHLMYVVIEIATCPSTLGRYRWRYTCCLVRGFSSDSRTTMLFFCSHFPHYWVSKIVVLIFVNYTPRVMPLTSQSAGCSLTTSHFSTWSDRSEPRASRYYFNTWYRVQWPNGKPWNSWRTVVSFHTYRKEKQRNLTSVLDWFLYRRCGSSSVNFYNYFNFIT